MRREPSSTSSSSLPVMTTDEKFCKKYKVVCRDCSAAHFAIFIRKSPPGFCEPLNPDQNPSQAVITCSTFNNVCVWIEGKDKLIPRARNSYMTSLRRKETKTASELRDNPREEGTRKRKEISFIDTTDAGLEQTRYYSSQPHRSLEEEKSLANEFQVFMISIFVTTLYLL